MDILYFIAILQIHTILFPLMRDCHLQFLDSCKKRIVFLIELMRMYKMLITESGSKVNWLVTNELFANRIHVLAFADY